MKKAISLILALTTLLLPMAGCSGGEDDMSYFSYYEIIEDDTAANTDSGSTVSKSNDTVSKKEEATSSKNSSNKTNSTVGTADTTYDFMAGKTYTMAITGEPQYETTSFKAMISAFQTKYKCKIKTATIDFGTYNQQVSQRMSTGEPYDICFMHGSMFPTGPISGVYADLTEAVKQVDSSALDTEKSNMFKWNGKLYGVCNSNSAYPWIFYYNKALFEEYGLEDPRTLYEKGEWTWDKIFEMGAEVTDQNEKRYFLSSYYVQTQMYGTSTITIKDGKVQLNLKSEGTRLALELLQKIYCGNNAIGQKLDGSEHTKAFFEGRNFMYCEESSKYPDIAVGVKKSMAFNKKIDNIGIVPVPLPAQNTEKAYPTGWLTAVCAGEGSDARVAVAWANFMATYKSTVKSENEYSKEDQALLDSLMAGKILPNRHGAYATSSTKSLSLHETLVTKVRNGEDIAKTIDELYPQYVACIEATVGKGNYKSSN